MNAAIEAAIWAFAQSRKDALGGLPKMPTADEVAVFMPHMTVAIIAFLRNCEVSENVRQAGIDCLLEHTDDEIDVVEMLKAMASQLATELEGK